MVVPGQGRASASAVGSGGGHDGGRRGSFGRGI